MQDSIDWEQAYRQNETGWDRGQVSPVLADRWAGLQASGPVLVPGCGRGHDTVWLAQQGAEVTGLDLAPTAIAEAKGLYPDHADRFVVGDLFDLGPEMAGRFEVVVEHTCLSGMPPALRPRYEQGVRHALKPGGLLAGVWYLNPDLDPGETGPPFPLPLEELDALFATGWEIVEDETPAQGFEERVGRERWRVLRRVV